MFKVNSVCAFRVLYNNTMDNNLSTKCAWMKGVVLSLCIIYMCMLGKT